MRILLVFVFSVLVMALIWSRGLVSADTRYGIVENELGSLTVS